MPAQQHGMSFFFPCVSKLVTAKAHGDGGHLPGTPPQMTAQFVGPKNDVKKPCPIQVVEILCRVFYLIGLPRALIDEAPRRLGVRLILAVYFPDFIVPLKPRIADGDKVPLAKCFVFKRRTDSLVTARDTASFCFRHLRKTR